MSRFLGLLRVRRMVRRGLLVRDGQRWILTPKGRALAGLLDRLDGRRS